MKQNYSHTMKRFLSILCIITVLFSFAACGSNAGESQEEDNTIDHMQGQISNETHTESTTEKKEDDMMKIEIIVGNKTFSGVLYDNAASKALTEQLPMTLNMKELNGNEKYYYFDGSLPTDSSRPSEIKTGDIMLYGNNCLVLFYKSFSTVYSYTPLGTIDDPAGLATALGNGDVQVTFRKG